MYVSAVSDPISVGMVPVKALLKKINSFNAVSSPISEGMVPVKAMLTYSSDVSSLLWQPTPAQSHSTKFEVVGASTGAGQPPLLSRNGLKLTPVEVSGQRSQRPQLIGHKTALSPAQPLLPGFDATSKQKTEVAQDSGQESKTVS